MMRKIRACVAMLMLTIAVGIEAQTMQWAVRPTGAELESYGQLVKVRKGGKCGLIMPDGKEIVPAQYDSISPFADGFALVLNRRGRGMKVEGILSEGDYELLPVLVGAYIRRGAVFSEGKMPVANESGVWGYLGTDGNMAIDFQFSKAYPFSEGWASVEMKVKGKNEVYYIDRNLNNLAVAEGSGLLAFASTFSGGKAVVYTYYGRKGFYIDRRGRTLDRYKVSADEVKVNPDHSIGNRIQQFNDQMEALPPDSGWEVFAEGGKYGYKYQGQVILPAQLDRANAVRGGFASVYYHGQNGILRTVDKGVSAQFESTTLQVNDSSDGSGFLQVNLPDQMADAGLQLRMTDEHGQPYRMTARNTMGEQRTFMFTPASRPQHNGEERCRLEISTDGLLLARQEVALHYQIEEKKVDVDSAMAVVEPVKKVQKPAQFRLSAPVAASSKANREDKFYVNVLVTNVGDEGGKTTVTLYVGGQRVGTSNEIYVRGHGSARAQIGIPNVTKTRIAAVKATLPNGRSAEAPHMTLTPFW